MREDRLGMDLTQHGISVADVHRNLAPSALYRKALLFDEDAAISSAGALIAYSGDKTGRCPKDKRIIRHDESEKDVWWGDVNIAMEEDEFRPNVQRACDFLNGCERLYVVDGFAGWDPKYRIKVRVICARPYHALFMHNMLIRPTVDELANFGEPEAVILNAGQCDADPEMPGVTSNVHISISLESKEMVIMGTEYAGEMKKGVFTLMNYLMPKKGVLSMHCSATTCSQNDESSVLFGLSGTGKTTLSADPHRDLIGDDEHCWTDQGIFNIEGGCYAKAIDLSPEAEPEIFHALKYGAVLENVIYDKKTYEVDYSDTKITQNTRGSYPIDFISNAKIPCVGGHPTNVIFLTCDAFGVLPPVSHLTPEQAMYHFISGYTAKVAGTEEGVTDPQATFSPCFGGPFLVWHPGKYAELLAEKMRTHHVNAWLINTGWSGGGYGVGARIKLKYTREIVDAIHDGTLAKAPTVVDPVFGFNVVTECTGVENEMLIPEQTWEDKSAYAASAAKLANLFAENFKAYEKGVSKSVREAGPCH